MASTLQFNVVKITPRELRTYSGRSYYQRTFHCFNDDSVFTHAVNCQAGETPEAIADQKKLDSYLPGQYRADLEVMAGDRGRANFVIRNLSPLKGA